MQMKMFLKRGLNHTPFMAIGLYTDKTVAKSGTEQVAATESVNEERAKNIAKEAAETIAEKAAETIAKEVAEEAAETEEAVADVTVETVAEEMAENITDEVAETEIITVKMAETEEVIKSVENFRDFLGGTYKKIKNMVLNGLKLLEMHFKHIKSCPIKPKSCPYYNDSIRVSWN